MKKIIISLLFILSLTNSQAQQQTVDIGSDTLQWLQTNLVDRNAYFNGKSFKTILDSLYQLKAQIVEFTPPSNIPQACGGNRSDTTRAYVDPINLFANKLTMYFTAISDGGVVDQIQGSLSRNNLRNNQNNTINTHVKYFTVVFQQPVAYPRQIADSDNGTWLWTPFAEYFWGPHIIQSVSVGEY
jgi:hypothetical protein